MSFLIAVIKFSVSSAKSSQIFCQVSVQCHITKVEVLIVDFPVNTVVQLSLAASFSQWPLVVQQKHIHFG